MMQSSSGWATSMKMQSTIGTRAAVLYWVTDILDDWNDMGGALTSQRRRGARPLRCKNSTAYTTDTAPTLGTREATQRRRTARTE
eukprot:CAMPEP_0176440574 /NCGR_PEP_ID=MMETSP0127-20121128/20654_1 /TAXON_ID=938130 /ORGANISM="Platyophrya macrostoma, Strain WH" /LENGTH=84 /DNA_ID=CAMNT_0017825129 /DNA_START=317 /DNA_END=567 /DNA_ORIENTATION=+